MGYIRVIPRDFFNESKLLKCLGQLSLLVLEDSIYRHLTGVKEVNITEEFIEEDQGFNILLDSDLYGLVCANYEFCVNGIPMLLYHPYNSKEQYPLCFVSISGDTYSVFTETGEVTDEFITEIGRLHKDNLH